MSQNQQISTADGRADVQKFSDLAILLIELTSEATDGMDVELPAEVGVTVTVEASELTQSNQQ